MRGAFGRFAVSLASKLLSSLAGCIGVGGDWKSLTGVGDGRGASIGAGGGGVGSLGVSNGVLGKGCWESMAGAAGVITCSLGACVDNGGGATGRACGGVAVSIAVATRCI